MLQCIENTKVFLNKLKYDSLVNIRTYYGDYGRNVKSRLLGCGKKFFSIQKRIIINKYLHQDSMFLTI